MADRYWVGGTASWNSTVGTKWATTSGGVGGASVPTSSDDVYLDANSGAVTITISALANCRNLTCTGFTGTLTLSAGIVVWGSLLLASGMTLSGSSLVTMAATTTGWTINTAGKTLPALAMTGAGGGWTLAAALTSSGSVSVSAGSFDTANYTINASSLTSSGSTTRSIALGSSQVNLSISSTAMTLRTTGLTMVANTATINFTANVFTIDAGGVDLNGSSVIATTAIGGALTFTSGITMANFAVGVGSTSQASLTLGGNVTITGTASLNGNTTSWRLLVASSVELTQRTLTVGTLSASYIDFRDIAAAGTANWNLSAITGGSGDAGGNSGITFTSAATLYLRSGATSTWGTDTNWSLSSNGPADGRVPLPQDTARVDASSATALALPSARIGSLNTLGWSGTLTAGFVLVYGDFIIDNATNTSGTTTLTMVGRDKILSVNNRLVSFSVTISTATTITLGSAFRSSRSITGLTVSTGTLDTAGYPVGFTVDGGGISASSGTTLATGGSTFSLPTVSGSSGWSVSATTTLTGSPNITYTEGTTSNTKTFAGAGKTYGALTLPTSTGGVVFVITGSNTFASINLSGGTVAASLQLTAGTTQTVGWLNVFGTSGVQHAIRSTTAGTAATFAQLGGGTNATNWLTITDVIAPGWYSGANSTLAGVSSGWVASAASATTLAPDAVVAQTNMTGAVATVQDDPASPNSTYMTGSADNAVRVSFGTVAGPLVVGSGKQKFRVRMRPR